LSPAPEEPQSRHQRYSASRIQLAKQFGLEAVNAGAEIKDLVDSETSGDGADLVFECVGAPDSIREMTGLVRSRGKIVNLGVCKKPVKVDMQAVNFKEIHGGWLPRYRQTISNRQLNWRILSEFARS